MAKLTQEMKDMLQDNVRFVATVSKDGFPNIGPKRTLRVLDDETLTYNENTGKQTLANLLDNGKIAVAVVDWDNLVGYRFVGTAEVFTDGKPFEDASNFERFGKKVPKASVIIHIEKIYNLQIGPNAGELLEG